MAFRIVTAAAMALALGACGQAQQGFDEGFNKQFEKSAGESCNRTATRNGADPAAAAVYCTCFVDQMKGLSTAEKMNMTADSEKLKAAAEACKAKVTQRG